MIWVDFWSHVLLNLSFELCPPTRVSRLTSRLGLRSRSGASDKRPVGNVAFICIYGIYKGLVGGMQGFYGIYKEINAHYGEFHGTYKGSHGGIGSNFPWSRGTDRDDGRQNRGDRTGIQVVEWPKNISLPQNGWWYNGRYPNTIKHNQTLHDPLVSDVGARAKWRACVFRPATRISHEANMHRVTANNK